MAIQSEAPLTIPSVQLVGNAFVEQYYHILHQSPDMAHKFYQDSSVISRPSEDGTMTTVTTMKGINDRICSLDYTANKAEIKTADAQESYKDGVIVLVTGLLTGKEDNRRRKFIQTFFLAPQDKGYFVLNDVFRYIDENEPLEDNHVAIEKIDDNQSASLIPDPSHLIDSPLPDQATILKEEAQDVVEEPQNVLANEGQLPNENNLVEPEPVLSPSESGAAASNSSTALEDAPKMSYASILSSQTKRGSGPTKVYVPSKTEKRAVSSAAQAPPTESSAPIASSSVNSPDTSDAHEEDLGSMQNAIQSSPVVIGGQEAIVEIKRTTSRVASGRGRFPPAQGGFRGRRGHFFGGRGYVRSDFRGGRGEFSGGGEFSGRGGRGGGRGGRRGGFNSDHNPSLY